jgi:hypothetical protein
VWRYHAYPDYYRSLSALRHPLTLWGTDLLHDPCQAKCSISQDHPDIDTKLRVSKSLGGNRQRTYLPYLMINGLARKQPAAATLPKTQPAVEMA